MSESPLTGSALVAVGVIIVVIGGGVVIDGYFQQQMAQAWVDEKDSECFERAVDSYPADAPPEGMSQYVHERCGGDHRTNPYAGGEAKIGVGVVVALVGGAVVYVGVR